MGEETGVFIPQISSYIDWGSLLICKPPEFLACPSWGWAPTWAQSISYSKEMQKAIGMHRNCLWRPSRWRQLCLLWGEMWTKSAPDATEQEPVCVSWAWLKTSDIWSQTYEEKVLKSQAVCLSTSQHVNVSSSSINVSIYQYLKVSTSHSVNVSICQPVNVSASELVNILIPQYADVSMSQHVSISAS